MEKKNSILLTVIAVATLLVAVVGATFAYFTASIQDNRTESGGQGGTNISTGQVVNSTVIANIDGAAGKFTVDDVYPGHKEVAALQVTAVGVANSKTGVNFNYDVIQNGLGDQIKVSLYKSDTLLPTTENHFGCTKETRTVGNEAQYYETCPVGNETMGTLIESHILTEDLGKIKLGTDIIQLDSIGTTKTVYYYVVVEFMDTQNGDQNKWMNRILNGVVSAEPAPGA